MVKRERDPKGKFLEGPPSYQHLLSHDVVKDWINSYQSRKTQDDYMRCLELVLRETELKPSQLLALGSEDARRRVMRVVHSYLQKGKGTMARQIQLAARSFFEANNRELKFRKTDRIKKTLKKINYETIPSKHDIYRMIDAAKELRNKAIILCLFQSGVRVGCLCNWTFSLVKDQLYPAIKIPVYLKITNQVDTKLNGYGLPYYYTFLQREAAEALKAYLDERMQAEGMLKGDTPVFAPLTSKSGKDRVNKERILEMIKNTAKNIGLDPKKLWTHTLRKSFRKVLNASDIDEDTKEAVQGHKLPGSRANYFDYHDLDEIANKYMKCDFSRAMQTVSEDAKKELLLSMWRDQAKMYGIDPLKVRIERENPSVEEEVSAIQGEIKRFIDQALRLRENVATNNNHYENRVIAEKDLESYLNGGWEFQAQVNKGKCVVRRPKED